jgi:pimeloyl-ACP methyl ester carboxylesterase
MSIELNHKIFGQGDPLIIMHGLFGTLDNWQTLAKRLAEQYMVVIIDLRNHGRSPHVPSHTYQDMSADLAHFMESNWMYHASIVGHSMGGKVAMQFASDYPDMVDKLVVVDIAPKDYRGGHELILEALETLDLSKIQSRTEAEEHLLQYIPEFSVRQFLLKNLSRTPADVYEWKMNLPVLIKHYQDILKNVDIEQPFEGPTLFIRGAESKYIQDSDKDLLHQLYPNARLETIAGAGHWVHAEQPEAFYQTLSLFLNE